MSSSYPDNHIDLIDFHVGSPVLPRRSSLSEIHFEQESENLIDTELPIFEQKLQTASNTISCHSRKNSVDVEDILINIDSDEYETDSLDGEKVETETFFGVCEGISTENENNESTLPIDNFEALLVLRNLDELLNATLEESNEVLDENLNDQWNLEGTGGNDENTQHIIEECLEDLDNYLKAIEDDDDDTESHTSIVSSEDQSVTRDDSSFMDLAGSSSVYDEHEHPQVEFNEENERQKLRKIESNYNKFVSSGIVNRGYVDTENNAGFMLNEQLRRPSSSCAMTSQLLNRKHPFRATTLAVIRKERPRLLKILKRRKSLSENNTVLHSTLPRTSGTDANCNTPENGLTSNDVTRERHAHASNDCCTGTVIVEPLHRQSKATSSSASAVHEVPNVAATKEETRTTLRGTWLRSSMRRLQHLNLPTTERVEDESGIGSGEGDTVRSEGVNNGRPLSAPSRLPPTTAPAERASRPRSRESVSHEPNGRARSSSASSHSRRPRSLSSSVTSLASSAESTPTVETARNTTRNTTTSTTGIPETAANTSPRRYSFLIAGILYGAGKRKTLEAIEASRADEKARKKVERDAMLVEERRLAAERDFNQIVEIFSPPPRLESKVDVQDQDYNHVQDDDSNRVQDQEYNQSTPGLNTEKCDSSYENMLGDDTKYNSPSTVRVIEPEIPKPDDYPSGTKFYDRPLDFSVDDFTKSYGEKGDGGVDVDRQGSESNDCDVEIPKNVEGHGYIITDFGDIPVMPSEDESQFKPDE